MDKRELAMDDIQRLEQRVTKIEVDFPRDVKEALTILHKIEERLLGSLDKETPGLINRVTQLESQKLKNIEHIAQLQITVKALEMNVPVMVDLASKVQKLQESLDQIQKYKWVTYGVLLTCGFIVTKAWDWILKKGF